MLDGQGEAAVDEQQVPLRGESLIHCLGSETFSVRNTGSTRLSLLVFLYPGNPKFAADVR